MISILKHLKKLLKPKKSNSLCSTTTSVVFRPGWPEHGPYDAIVVTAAAEFVPPPLLEQLKEGGKMTYDADGEWEGVSLRVSKKGAG